MSLIRSEMNIVE